MDGTTTTATSGERAAGDQRPVIAATLRRPDKFSVTEHGILCDPYGRRPATAAEQWAFREVARLRAALKPFAEAMALAEAAAIEPYSPDTLLEDCRAHVTLYEFAMAHSALEAKEVLETKATP